MKAVSKSDQFDFLIDILPRDEPFPGSAAAAGGAGAGPGSGKGKKAAKHASVSCGKLLRVGLAQRMCPERNRAPPVEMNLRAKQAKPRV